MLERWHVFDRDFSRVRRAAPDQVEATVNRVGVGIRVDLNAHIARAFCDPFTVCADSRREPPVRDYDLPRGIASVELRKGSGKGSEGEMGLASQKNAKKAAHRSCA